MFFLIVVVPAIAAILVSMILDFWGIGAFFALVWIGYVIFNGSKIVKQQEFLVTEILGKSDHTNVRLAGWHIFLPWIEQIRAEGDLRRRKVAIYEEPGSVIDFSDGASAPVRVSAWYQIGDPDAAEANDTRQICRDVYAWVYQNRNSEDRIRSLIDGALRPLLQELAIDQANADRNGITERVVRKIAPEMRKFGAYIPIDGDGLIIEDIMIPAEIANLRAQILKAKKIVEASIKEAVGKAQVINILAKECGISQEQARSMFLYLQGLETIKSAGANVTLIGSGITGVVGTLNVGNRKGES